MQLLILLMILLGSRWVVQKSSSLCIAGHTNINHFTCGVPQCAEPDTLYFLPEGSRGSVPGIPLCGTVRLNIDDFDCHNKVMTDDFKTTVRANRFPQLKISFINLERMPSARCCPEAVKGWVEIELAGTCRLFEIDYTILRSEPGVLELDGKRTLAFHDFALDPPRKMGGLIKVNDTLDVHFSLYLKQIN
ncbi:YceI family protein [Dinghuibacter silviterrae]|uniref:YceI-like domain-containing protein n=1 Tax=Dinghuibacter silviterrae TaxID=1539049 RepID=A0A4R8DIB0_9BACT|nr:YceI family protein [Dinghuibacter silviterrae]TDW96710.1 hypothetical protein EDB95_4546 [Dinghuibacter silviterrae]